MAHSPLARQTVQPADANFGEPAIVAFRRPGDSPSKTASGPIVGELPPVLLRLPDLNQIVAPVRRSTNRMVWIATGVLALIAVGLLVTGKKQPASQATTDAPRWNAPAAPNGAGQGTDTPGQPAAPTWKLPAAAANAPASLYDPSTESTPPSDPAVGGPADPMSAPTGTWPSDVTPEEESMPWPGATQSQPPAVEPVTDPATTGDPWPSELAPPGEARQGNPAAAARLSERPRPTTARGPAPRPGEAQFEGGIRNLEVSPRYDGTRSRLY